MKGILIIFLCILGLNAGGQSDSCEYTRKEVDEFTGSSVTITKFSKLYTDLTTVIRVQLVQVDSFYSIVIGMNIGQIYAIDQGAQLMFILANDSVFATSSLKSMVASGQPSSAGTIWYGETPFDLSKEGLATLATYGIKKLRIYTSGGYVEKTISAKNSNSVKDMANCLD